MGKSALPCTLSAFNIYCTSNWAHSDMPIGTCTHIVDAFVEVLQTVLVGAIVSATSLVFLPTWGTIDGKTLNVSCSCKIWQYQHPIIGCNSITKLPCALVHQLAIVRNLPNPEVVLEARIVPRHWVHEDEKRDREDNCSGTIVPISAPLIVALLLVLMVW